MWLDVGKTQDNSDEVTLGIVVLIVSIVVDDKVVSTWQVGTVVLELLDVIWVLQNVVSVDTGQMLELGFLVKFNLLQHLVRVIQHGLDTEHSRVELLGKGELSV